MGDDDTHPRDEVPQKRSDIFDRKYDKDAHKKASEDADRPVGNELFIIEFKEDGSVRMKVKSALADEDAMVWVRRKSGGKIVVGMGYGEEEYDTDKLPEEIRRLFTGKSGNNFAANLPPLDYIIDNGRVLSYEEYLFKLEYDLPIRPPWGRLDPRFYKQLSERYWREYQDGRKTDPEFVEKFRQLVKDADQRRQEQERYRTWGAPGQ